MTDVIHHPEHYTTDPSGVECIYFARNLDFCRGNALKYLWRFDLKGKPVEDLDKALQYLEFAIEQDSQPVRDTGLLDAFEAWYFDTSVMFVESPSREGALYQIYAGSDLGAITEYVKKLRDKVAGVTPEEEN